MTEIIFHNAVQAIDAGDIETLRNLLHGYPQLTGMRLSSPSEGYFKQPYLLWFIADNPIRNETLPENIVDITRLIINEVKKHNAETFQQQIDYALGLVTTGRIPRESGKQIQLIDLLINEGATIDPGISALANGNIEAAKHLLKRGAKLSLAVAVSLQLTDDIMHLAKRASQSDKQVALLVAAFYGNTDMIAFLINSGVDINAYIDDSSGFHSHATALHQAIFSGSLASVKILVEAGADTQLKDRIYQGTALDWAKHMELEEPDEIKKSRYAAITAYLNGR